MVKPKTRKLRGRKTAGWGSRKKHRGKGSKGGAGMAGTGKRGDVKKTFILAKIGKSYYGKRGFTSLKKKGKSINVDRVGERIIWLIEKKFAVKDAKGDITVDLTKAGFTKLLGRGNIDKKITIKVKSYSKKAKEKIEEMGGTIIGKEVKKGYAKDKKGVNEETKDKEQVEVKEKEK